MWRTNIHDGGISSVRIAIVGDSGVGKTSLANLICTGSPLLQSGRPPTTTRGCTLSVKTHNPSTLHSPVTVELVDIAGRSNNCLSRRPFYSGIHGLILVHDVRLQSTLSSLHSWRNEALESLSTLCPVSSSHSFRETDIDVVVVQDHASQPSNTTSHLESVSIPMLVVGTMIDMSPLPPKLIPDLSFLIPGSNHRSYLKNRSIIDEYGLQSIHMSTQVLSEAGISTIDSFIDTVISHASAKVSARGHGTALTNPYSSTPSLQTYDYTATREHALPSVSLGSNTTYGRDERVDSRHDSVQMSAELLDRGYQNNSNAVAGSFTKRVSNGIYGEGRKRYTYGNPT
ncbi:hypothetical protein BDEG_26809 [Batrachochytrium dendrobatidis JEL423]|uniref:Uncharacterized protein n=1 Tax=Batrachochytrium dendrobatidis (strain JEL423) TaxID=403673 RepID=A0A177WVL0_BATDL|nr:hypothetical protein BDEG_26809 [Batrachochytrium dendrobatidis JEL423]